MRAALIAASVVALGACDAGSPPTQDPSGPVGAAPVADNGVDASGEVSAVEAGDLPRASEGLRFVGKWAADERSCESAAWQFTQTTLQTPAGSACSFNRVTEVPGGYDIQATCTAEGPPTSDTLQIRFAESAKAMLFESESIADTGLLFCGRDV